MVKPRILERGRKKVMERKERGRNQRRMRSNHGDVEARSVLIFSVPFVSP